jgi:hypothetical protein
MFPLLGRERGTAGFLFWAGSVLASVFLAMPPAQGASILYDFDSGAPALHPTMGLPQSQTNGGVTATFSGRFSLQSDGTTFYNLAGFTNFSGNYLYPNDVFSPSLAISFDQPLTSLSFDFVTADFGLDVSTTLRLTALEDLTTVGTTTSQAAFAGDGGGWGLGTLTFTSAVPFNNVNIVILPGAGSDFLADNFLATTTDAGIPEPGSLLLTAAGLFGLTALGQKSRKH